MKKKNKLLILGPTGNIGIPLINQLRDKHANITIGVHSNVTNIDLPDFNSVELDYSDIDSLNEAMNGVSCVFVLIPDSPQMVEYAKNINSAIKAGNISHFVFLSGLGVTVAPETWLSKQLIQCENIFRKSGLSGAIVRPCFFMQNFINHYPPQPDNNIYLPIDDGKISYIDTRDVASFCASILTTIQEKDGINTYHLSGQYSLDLYEIADLFTKVLGKKYTYIPISIEVAKKQMEDNQLPSWLINMMDGIYGRVKQNAYSIHSNDFQVIMGRQPSEFSKFIESYRGYFEKVSTSELSQ